MLAFKRRSTRPGHRVRAWLSLPLVCAAAWSAPQLLDDQFNLPPGFHIYRAAPPELAGGSYALTIDGQGRLLVGDGEAVRRLVDLDGDGVFDQAEVIATGLGWRGPQGLLLDGDRLYAVGGDGLQMFEGYDSSGPLVHRGRLGARLNTGGDHSAHTILRGHDGFIYLVTGDGGGIEGRSHITEESSPVLYARNASVFRISPDGQEWECLSTGGRNPPSLGMNRLGDLFSLDSDMEWHVGLPWYRPVRLNHWLIGGDQGWEPVGARPPYWIDALPPVLEVGRGSPDWGVFYEHTQFPERYRDAFFVCDYRWKGQQSGQYSTAGRLLTFLIRRRGAEWTAEMEVFAEPKPGARDSRGRSIQFALVDIAVAPDGSLLATDHNQGVWRIFQSPDNEPLPSMALDWNDPGSTPVALLDELLELPQPGAEWSRIRQERLIGRLGEGARPSLRRVALDPKAPLDRRLRAVRLIAPQFSSLELSFLKELAKDSVPELRAQAAWLLSIRRQSDSVPTLLTLLRDQDPFVRRRAAEALTRYDAPAALEALLVHLGAPSRLTRFACMAALAHQPADRWLLKGAWSSDPQTRMRSLTAAFMRREPPSESFLRSVVDSLRIQVSPYESPQERLDFLRILGMCRESLEDSDWLRPHLRDYLVSSFPDDDPNIRWEQVRVIGAYRFSSAFRPLLIELERESDPVAQFHIAQALCRLPAGWSDAEEERLWKWIKSTQSGWFASFGDKGRQFPEFWSTVLAEFARNHRSLVLERVPEIDFGSLLGAVAIDLLGDTEDGAARLLRIYELSNRPEPRRRIALALGRFSDPKAADFLRRKLEEAPPPELRNALLIGLSRQPVTPATEPYLIEGLRSPSLDVFHACARAASRSDLSIDERLAEALIQRMARAESEFHEVEKTLTALAERARPGFALLSEKESRVDDATRKEALDFWTAWFLESFGRPLEIEPDAGFSNEELLDLLASDRLLDGDAERGREWFIQLQCQECHGGAGPVAREAIFGPDLSDVTQRLTRSELAEAIVYPSEQVPERFKAMEIELRDGRSLTGFVTEENQESVTLVDRERVHRLDRERIKSIRPQSTSLMPEGLLNSLDRTAIRDLMAFIRRPTQTSEEPEETP